MGIVDFLFKRREKPQQEVDAGKLGLLHWSDDDAAWKGKFNEIEFFVAPDSPLETMPGEALVYAESILMNLEWLKETIEREKINYSSNNPQFKSELQNLGIESLDFSIHKNKGRYLNCQLGYGLSDKFWSADFHDRKFTGIGFDS